MAGINIKKVNKDRRFEDAELCLAQIERHTVLRNENWPWDTEEPCILLITETAKRDIFDFIRWNDRGTSLNRLEQGGILAGCYYRSPTTGQKYAVVLRAFPMRSVQGTPAFWDASAEEWKDADMEKTRWANAHGVELVTIGWFHTHPNDLPTFMSGTDRTTQSRIFYNDYNFALVLNPHTLSWKAFRGEAVLDACCCMLDTDDLELLTDARVKPVPEEPRPEEPKPEEPRPEEPAELRSAETPGEVIVEETVMLAKPGEADIKLDPARKSLRAMLRSKREFTRFTLDCMKNRRNNRKH